MPILVATNLTHTYADKAILSEVSLSIEPGERVGLVGRNGAGKSTLIKALGGKLRPDSGSVSLQAGARAGYLEQDPVLDPQETLRGVAESAYVELHRLHAELNSVFDEMGGADGPALDRLLRRQADLERRIEAAGGFAVDHKIDETLHGLGFSDAQFDLPATALSGGQRARAALARLLLEQPDVLLLDEPTNHLDIDGRLWLEQYLSREYRGAVIMISHDRYLLDAVVDRIVEVEQARLIDYPGNYSTFRELRAERREAQLRAYEKEQDKFRREEAFIRRYKAGQRAKQARGRQWKLERAKEESTLERPMELGTFGFTLPKPERSGDIVISTRGLSKAFAREDGSQKVLFNDLNLSVARGERWGVVGPNGAGKTTLVRCLLKEIEPDAGQVTLGSRVSVGYFRQIQTGFDPEKPVYRHLQDVIAKENPSFSLTEQGARDLAGAFLFSGKDQDKEMGLLSGGERARVFLAALLASSKNLLILDEPTNHLDIPSAERLEEALSCEGGYEGTILIISHDRALIDATCDHLLVLDGEGGVQVSLGNYSDWVETKARRESERAAEAAARTLIAEEQERKRREAAERSSKGGSGPPVASATSPTGGAGSPSQPGGPAKKSKFSWMRPEQLEARMGELEGERIKIEAELGEPEAYRDAGRIKALGAELDRVQAELAELEDEWLRKTS